MKRSRIFSFVFVLVAVASHPEISNASPVEIEEIIFSDPIYPKIPLFIDSLDVGDILDEDFIGRKTVRPSGTAPLPWFGGRRIPTRTASLEDGGLRLQANKNDIMPMIMYHCFYVHVNRFQNIDLTIKSDRPFALFVDGEEKARSESSAPEEITKSTGLKLARGSYSIIVKSVLPPGSPAGRLALDVACQFERSVDAGALDRRLLYRYDYIRRIESITDLAVSPDGSLGAVVLRSRQEEPSPTRSWIELWDLEHARRKETIALGSTVRSPGFSPDSRSLAFIAAVDDAPTLFLMDLWSGELRAVARNIKTSVAPRFSSDGKSIYLLVDRRKIESEKNYEIYRELRDKLTDWYNNRELVELSIETGAMQRLSRSGDFMVQDFALSPDGRRVAYSRMVPIPRRPFFATEIWIEDLETSSASKAISLATGFENSPLNLVFSPDGRSLAFTSAPDTVGSETSYDHNAYNSDIFMLDVERGTVNKLTRRLDPSVVERGAGTLLQWRGKDSRIYFLAVDRSARKILAIKPGEDGWRQIPLHGSVMNVDFMSNIAEDGTFLYVGSSPTEPRRIFLHRIGRGRDRVLFSPNQQFFTGMELGSYERFDFTDSRGRKIDGWIILPPGFDAKAKLPLIVYYYGGVSPRLLGFSFLNQWLAANGYAVYVLNPSGAYGSGDRFADLHVNDWGELASADIMEGVEKLLESKSYIDRSKVGGFGGSYGGFITMDLATKSDLFGALCAWYGISNLASYWGAGTWGFTYGDIAMARRYPWKDEEFFVEKSPLFHVDEVKIPILLLHGKSDVNVPVGESRQFFTALRVLGRDAVLVEFPGEDHGIAGSTKSLVDHREMMLEWFDMHLKGQPEAWHERWKEGSP